MIHQLLCFDLKSKEKFTPLFDKLRQNVIENKSFPKISPHELIDHTVWPLEGGKIPSP